MEMKRLKLMNVWIVHCQVSSVSSPAPPASRPYAVAASPPVGRIRSIVLALPCSAYLPSPCPVTLLLASGFTVLHYVRLFFFSIKLVRCLMCSNNFPLISSSVSVFVCKGESRLRSQWGGRAYLEWGQYETLVSYKSVGAVSISISISSAYQSTRRKFVWISTGIANKVFFSYE